MATSTSTRVRAAVDYEVCMIREQKGRRKGGRREEKGKRKMEKDYERGERWEKGRRKVGEKRGDTGMDRKKRERGRERE